MTKDKKNFFINYDLHKDNLFKKYFQLTNESRKLRYSLTRIENYLKRELTVADFKEKKLPKIEDIQNLVENWGPKTIDFIKFYLIEENLDKLILDNQHLAVKKKEENFIHALLSAPRYTWRFLKKNVFRAFFLFGVVKFSGDEVSQYGRKNVQRVYLATLLRLY
jgi:hypothetical protein